MQRITLRTGLLTFILVAVAVNSAAVRVRAEEDHGAPGIAVDLAKAMIAEKDVMAGAKEFTKEKYDDWMWKSIGGYENLWSGRLTGDAYVVQLREKVTGYMEIIESIQNFVLAVEAGNYDEAAFIAIDQAVGAIDHPLVSITWEMAKLTYESHKAVQETGAAVLVEQLYSSLHRDRRLFGSVDGEMAQIPEDSQTVDYFFDKYIVTDASTREMVKAYVQTRLGEEWPEQSWSSWLSSLRTIGSGVDVAAAEEVAALTGEWRNIARKWILAIIKDVNAEARKWYHLARLSQQKAAFEAFAAQYKAFEYDLPKLLEMFDQGNAIRANLAKYQGLLTSNSAALQKAQGDLAKTSNPAALTQLYDEAMKYRREAMNYRADMFTINEFALAEAFERLEGQWSVLAQQIDAKIPPPPTSPSAAIQANPVGSGWGSEYDARVDAYVRTYFAELLRPIPVPDISEMQAFRQEFLEKLNSRERQWNLATQYGNVMVYDGIALAAEVRDRWNALRPTVQYHTQNLVRDPGYKPMWDGIDIKLAEVAEQVGPNHELTGGSFNSLLEAVGMRARSTYHNVIYPTAYAYFDELDRWMADQLEAATILRNARATQFTAIMSQYSEADRYLRQTAQISEQWIENPQGDPLGLDDYISSIVQPHIYTYYAGIDYDTYNLAYTLESQAAAILGGWTDGGYDFWLEKLHTYAVAVDKAAKIASQIELPTGTDLNEIMFFVVNSQDIYDVKKVIHAASAASNYTSTMRSMLDTMNRQLETDYANRHTDANWLLRIRDEWQIWINSQLQKGYIERFNFGQSSDTQNDIFLLCLPEGKAFAGASRFHQSAARATDGMILAMEPYPHFLTDTEIALLQATMTAQLNWSASSAYRFVKQYAPETAQRFEEMLQFRRVGNYPDTMPLITAAEPNFVHPRAVSSDINSMLNTQSIILESQLKQAMDIVERLSYKDLNYEARLSELRDLLPNTLVYASAAEQTNYLERANQGMTVDYTKMILMTNPAYQTPKLIPEAADLERVKGLELGELYIVFCQKLQAVIDQERLDRIVEFEKEAARKSQFWALAAQVNATIDMVRDMMESGNYNAVAAYEGYYQTYMNQLKTLPGPDPENIVTEALSELKHLFDQARVKAAEAESAQARVLDQIKAFYDRFSRAYESRNTSAVLRLIDDDWEAADGSDTWDLEDTLDRNFRVYDEIQYKVSNINVVANLGEGRYLVSYELTIVSRIFKRNLRHEEKSLVEEEIYIDAKGVGKIVNTRKGRLWV